MDPANFHANDTWLEKHFRATEQSNHLDLATKALVLHRGWSQLRRFLHRSLQENFEHGRADCQRDDGVQLFVDGSAVDVSYVSELIHVA